MGSCEVDPQPHSYLGSQRSVWNFFSEEIPAEHKGDSGSARASSSELMFPFEGILKNHTARRMQAQIKEELKEALSDGHERLMRELHGEPIDVELPEKRLRLGATKDEEHQFNVECSVWKTSLFDELSDTLHRGSLAM